ncbi:unnamed protein product [Lasius platythorax]|uniref:Uncharacterized protein n=1 Tax=Lasius platythorax TaxID=488582 RepID=A0AAV2NW02_9HYME
MKEHNHYPCYHQTWQILSFKTRMVVKSYIKLPCTCLQVHHGFRYRAGYELRSPDTAYSPIYASFQAARLDVIYRVCNKISHVTCISSITTDLLRPKALSRHAIAPISS